VTQPLATGSKAPRPNLRFPIQWKGSEIWPDKQWLWSKDRVEAALANDEIVVNETEGKLNVRVKQYLKDEHGQIRKTKPLSLMIGPYNQEGSKETDSILGKDIFDFPKPSALIRFLVSISVSETTIQDDIVLDFMAGSGTTAHAIIELNKQDVGKRKFILVQLPEPCNPESTAFKAGYKTIADICKERVRRVIQKLDAEDSSKLDLKGTQKPDRGFRVFKLAESNFKPWNAEVTHDAPALEQQLELHVSHIQEGRADQDILFEVLLKSGFPLTTPVETVVLAGKTVHSVAGGQLLICLERKLTLELIRAIAERKPERVVCLDEGFVGNDQLKTNAAHIFEPTDRREAKSDARRFRTV